MDEEQPRRIDLDTAAIRRGCKRRSLEALIRSGELSAVKERVLGKDGVFRYRVTVEVHDLDAIDARPLGETRAQLVAAVTAAAPRFTEGQRAEIALALQASRLR